MLEVQNLRIEQAGRVLWDDLCLSLADNERHVHKNRFVENPVYLRKQRLFAALSGSEDQRP